MWIPRLVTVTPVLSTAAYAAGDVLFDTTEVNDALTRASDRCVLQNVFVIDEDSLAAADVPFDLLFLEDNFSLGTINTPPNITDADARAITGFLPIVAADYLAAAASGISGVKVAQKLNVNMVLKAKQTTKDLYIAAIHRGAAGTHTVSGLKIKLGFLERE